ncbi:MAG: hypothetical protein IKE66_10280 [Hyphomicrobium sp.]|nr:hypothetical protein [Hyphomicrobium sp.]
MSKQTKKIQRDLPDVERETRGTMHNDEGSTQQMPTDAPDQRQKQSTAEDQRAMYPATKRKPSGSRTKSV